MSAFRVALSGDFLRADGSPAYPMFDLSPLSAAGIAHAYVPARDGVMAADDLAGFDALILLGHRFDGRSIPTDGRLGLVARFGVGYDNVDVEACSRAGIAVAITPDGVRRPVAVTVLTFMLALTSRLLVKDRLTREGPAGWARRSEHMGTGLTGRVLGQLGIGNIGAEVFRLAAPLGMRFIAHDPFAPPGLARDLGVELVSIEDLFRQADVLSISVPLNEATNGLVGDRLLGLMKPSAFLINTARGPVIDEPALVRALQAGAIAGAGLDVFVEEPVAADHPLLRLDNVILSPHALCWTDECFAGNGAADIRAVLDISRGDVPKALVNPRVAEEPAFQSRRAALLRRAADGER